MRRPRIPETVCPRGQFDRMSIVNIIYLISHTYLTC